ncbi:MAG TPA: hypothetical protein VN109_07690 [Devosia sp.]|jgi:hypothetical protein|nr:hypothetical protein [Devosia sp.]
MRIAAVIALVICAAAAPALASTDVTFTGTVSDTCTLAVPTPGIMALSTDGTILGSDQTLGVPATVTVLSLGGNTLTLSAPTLTSHPPGYAGGETVQMKFSGLASQPSYVSTQQTIALGLIPLTDLIVNMQVVNANGFVQGDYTAKTVLTCS